MCEYTFSAKEGLFSIIVFLFFAQSYYWMDSWRETEQKFQEDQIYKTIVILMLILICMQFTILFNIGINLIPYNFFQLSLERG